MPTISIIVPVYKVEPYLRQCVDSILNQTYTDFELILVDDGSPDGCPAICDEYAERDSRVIVIHKENGGLSSARNAGIDRACGEYLLFVDSDDYIAPEMIEKLYGAISEEGADIALCNYQAVYPAGFRGERIPECELNAGILSPLDMIKQLQSMIPYVIACNKLYRRVLFDTLRYTEGYVHEDEIIIHRLLGECRKVVAIPDKLYYYVQRDNSIMSSCRSVGQIDFVKACADRVLYYHERGWTELESLAASKCWYFLVSQYYLFDNDEQGLWKRKRALKDFRAILPRVLYTDKIRTKEKIAILLFAIDPAIYKWLFIR